MLMKQDKKTTASSPASTPKKRGNSRKKADAALARGIRREIHQARKAAAASESLKLPKPLRQPKDQPRYGTGLRMDTPGLHYAVNDPAPPVNDGGKVALNLSGKPDTEVVNFTYSHINKMDGNENYLEPQPPAPEFKGYADVFADTVTALLEAKRAVSAAAAARDAAFLDLMTKGYGIRVPYIQMASNGNTAVILTSGLAVRSGPTPAPTLQPPQNLRIDLNTNPGQFIVSWEVVTGSKSFVLQRSVVDGTSPDRNWQTVSSSPSRKVTLNDQTVGTAYDFRVATIGGATGQSVWSMEVIRTAA